MVSILQLLQQNIAAAAAWTEYSVAIPPRVNEVTLNIRSGIQPMYWYTTANPSPAPGSSANLPAVYGTIPAGASRTIRGLLGGQTIYFQTPGTSQVLEVDYYADN